MAAFFVIAVIVLVFLIIFQIAKASEYVGVLKGDERTNRQNNRINGFLMVIFLLAGLIGVYVCNESLVGKTLLVHDSSSVQGEQVDSMLHVTLLITGSVFVITQVMLFWFAYRYQESDKRKAFYFPHNNTMEIIWTVVPAIALTILVVIGLRNWFAFTSDAPKNAMEVEVTGKQFGWIFRYKGDDGVFGKKYFKMIEPANNSLGLNWVDNAELKIKDDPATHDDVVLEQTMYIVKDKPVKLIIGSRDVVHDVGLSWFRLKMDAVPGTPTTLWFTPKYTTKEMQQRTGNQSFQYEISCDQMCGNGHYSMKGVIEVVSQLEFDAWMAKQTPAYFAAFPEKNPANQKPATPVSDTAKSTAKTIPVDSVNKKEKI